MSAEKFITYLAAICSFLAALVSFSEGISFHLPANSQKCLREELRQHVLISGEYDVSEASGQRVDYVVSQSIKNV